MSKFKSFFSWFLYCSLFMAYSIILMRFPSYPMIVIGGAVLFSSAVWAWESTDD